MQMYATNRSRIPQVDLIDLRIAIASDHLTIMRVVET